MSTAEIHLIAAARPNFMKVAPVYHALAREDWCTPVLIHTGQHYDPQMSDAFFRDLRMPKPDIHLGIGSGSHAEQTGGVMIAYEKVCQERPPAWVIVVGDVNSTMACAISAKKLWHNVAHLEAGLRSRDWKMPEEINRIVTDSISDVLWTPSPDADENLRAEGIAETRIVRIGNIMIDSYELQRSRIERAKTREKFGLEAAGYGVVTLHRPSNVDEKGPLSTLVDALADIAARIPLVFAVHPRTRASLKSHELERRLAEAPGMHLSEPLGYIEFMGLVRESRLIITDSGGIQEETTYLDIPCITVRDTTERPITVQQGTNRLAGPHDVAGLVRQVLDGDWPNGRRPDLWDGQTAARLVADLAGRR